MMEMVFSPKHLAGKRVLITAGPTYEAIDPVRGITNRSSGLQGFSIARAARDFGAEVTLIAGPTHLTEPIGVKRIDVVSAREMDEAVQIELDRQRFDLFVSVAAVADWRPGAVSEKKIKKDPTGGILLSDLNWVENPDILARVGERPDKPLTMALLQKQPKAPVSLRLLVKSASASTPLLLWQTTPVKRWNPKPTAFSSSALRPRFPLVLPTNLPAPNSF